MTKTLALALAALLLLGACGDDDDDDAADGAATTTTAEESTTSSTSATTTEPDVEAAGVVDATATVDAWLAALASGDDDEAIALVAPRSLEAFGGPEGFRERRIELAEGWEAWGHATGVEMTAVAVPGTPDTEIVILHGEVAQEGPPEERWTSIPVVATADGDRVEPFLDLGNVEIHPASDTEIAATPTFEAYVLGGRDVTFVVDDGDATTPALEGADGDQQKGTLALDEPLPPGRHALTVVLWNADGVMTRTFNYSVDG